MAAQKDHNGIEKDLAMDHSLMTFRRAWAADVKGLRSWGASELDPDPLLIYDLNGELLFFEFTAMDGNAQVGRLKAGATKRLGAAVATLEMGSRPWDPDQGTTNAKKRAKELFPKADITATSLVCYSYPKIGVKVDLKERGKKKWSLLFDVADHTHVDRFGEDEPEGQTAWSFLDSLSPSQVEKRVKLWDLRDREREAAAAKTPKLFARGFTAKEAEKVRPTLVVDSPYIMPFYSQKVLTFGPRCDSHKCFELYAQQTSVYCAVATGQMILDFYRYYSSQDAIATAMGTGAGGTSNPGQVQGYETLSKGCLNATYDSTAAWTEAKAEIIANRPLKSGIPGHARACAGWKRQNIYLIGQPRKKWLQIYDPWPWNADICSGGQVYWEDWDAINHTNFIYLRHRTTTCN